MGVGVGVGCGVPWSIMLFSFPDGVIACTAAQRCEAHATGGHGSSGRSCSPSIGGFRHCCSSSPAAARDGVWLIACWR